MTRSIEVFNACAVAFRNEIEMVPRSSGDKEFFAQAWFTERLEAAGISFNESPRNSYPDYWLQDGDVQEGYEVKGLAYRNGRPSRKDFDSNSTVPAGMMKGQSVFLVFFLYSGSRSQLRRVHSISISHCDLVNADSQLGVAHKNHPVHGFGSYGDGFIRNRKMYVFPHPFTIDPTGLGRCRLIVPAKWELDDSRITKVGAIERQFAPMSIRGFSERLNAEWSIDVDRVPSPRSGQTKVFNVYERR